MQLDGKPYSQALEEVLALNDAQESRRSLIFLYAWRRMSLSKFRVHIEDLKEQLDCPDAPGTRYPPTFFSEHAEVTLPVMQHLISKLPATNEELNTFWEGAAWEACRRVEQLVNEWQWLPRIKPGKSKVMWKCKPQLYSVPKPIFRPAKPMMVVARRGC